MSTNIINNGICTLKEIADVTTGFTIRRNLEATSGNNQHEIIPFWHHRTALKTYPMPHSPNNDGVNIPLILIKNITADNTIDTKNLLWIENKFIDKDRQAKPEDILLLSQGAHNRAVVVPGKIESAIFSSFFRRIRITATNVLSDYLQWYLNQEKTKKYLKRFTVGTDIQFLPTRELKELPIPIPNIDTQKDIIAISNLQQEEKELSNKLITKKDILISSILNRLINNQPTKQTYEN